MSIEKFKCPKGSGKGETRLRQAWLKAMQLSDETGFVVRVVKEGEYIEGFALFNDDSLISALPFDDAIEDMWSLFDAMHAYFETVDAGEV